MSGRGVVQADIPGLVRLACRLREETHGCGEWHEPGVVKVIAQMKSWNYATVVEQILRKATDPDAKTPATLLAAVRSPLPSERPGARRVPIDDCARHPGKPASNCGFCRVDEYGDDADQQPARRKAGAPRPDNFRELVDAARTSKGDA